jgi:hypothetical protein
VAALVGRHPRKDINESMRNCGAVAGSRCWRPVG